MERTLIFIWGKLTLPNKELDIINSLSYFPAALVFITGSVRTLMNWSKVRQDGVPARSRELLLTSLLVYGSLIAVLMLIGWIVTQIAHAPRTEY